MVHATLALAHDRPLPPDPVFLPPARQATASRAGAARVSTWACSMRRASGLPPVSHPRGLPFGAGPDLVDPWSVRFDHVLVCLVCCVVAACIGRASGLYEPTATVEVTSQDLMLQMTPMSQEPKPCCVHQPALYYHLQGTTVRFAVIHTMIRSAASETPQPKTPLPSKYHTTHR